MGWRERTGGEVQAIVQPSTTNYKYNAMPGITRHSTLDTRLWIFMIINPFAVNIIFVLNPSCGTEFSILNDNGKLFNFRNYLSCLQI